MKQEESVQSIRHMLGEAMLFGAKLADNAYRGLLFDPGNHQIRDAAENLQRATQEFLAASALQGIDANQVLPLYEEMRELAQQRS